MSMLYDEDVVLWSEQQARLLREALPLRRNEPIDWENVAEEIESLGNSQVTEVRQRLSRIIEHLLKLQFSPAEAPRRGWRQTVRRQRAELDVVIQASPSLGRRVRKLADQIATRAARDAAEALADYGESEAAAAVLQHGGRYTVEALLGGFPPEPGAGAPQHDG